ncbi:hypothetical protein ACFUEM_08815 [Streptomyces anulatus]|uniref:hypothetical protein n=1 Tax=Streptomyces anulatus TaxID=1892 RepID=UPI0035E25C47
MTEYTAQCRAGRHDKITARIDGDSVELAATSHGAHKMETYLHTDDARTFARGILALADEADGGKVRTRPADVEPEPLADWEKDILEPKPKVGDRVCILRPEGCYRPEHTGSLGLLTEIDSTDCPYRVRTDAGDIVWAYTVEPASPSAVAITAPTREAYLHQAADLLGHNPYSAHDLIKLADYLAGEGA